MAQCVCPHCHSSNVTTSRIQTKKGDTVKAAVGVTAALGVAALTALASPVVAPVVAVLGVKGVERACHIGAHRAAEEAKGKWRVIHTCKNCGHSW